MTKRTCSLACVVVLTDMTLAFASVPGFHPDITETGKNLNNWHTLGQAALARRGWGNRPHTGCERRRMAALQPFLPGHRLLHA